MPLKQFNLLLKDLGTTVGLSNLKADAQGLCSLRFNDTVTIDLECSEEKKALIISSLIGTIQPEAKEKIYTDLLEANLLWSGTGGGTLGVDKATQTVFLCYQEAIEEMNAARFEELIKGFSDAALFWNEKIKAGKA